MRHAGLLATAVITLVSLSAGCATSKDAGSGTQSRKVEALTTGKAAPDFALPDTHGKTHKLSDEKGKFVVLEWVNYDCPFVKKHYGSGNMQKLQDNYTGQGVVWFSVNSSAAGKQGNFAADKVNDLIKEKKAHPTAYLMDPDGAVGIKYGARTTPHMFIIDPKGILIYEGAIDDIRSTDQADVPKAKNYVKQALDEALAGKTVTTANSQSYGCSVKY